tara:strand:+ start:5531 stop:6412 length:882 start_codon:yes stop_codon:yes gene_type:complete
MHKSGFVTILGNPNVGKSTLMNCLIGERLSIINPKAQTTRHRILGIVSDQDYQIIFSDTPGIISPHHDLHKSMMNSVKNSLEDADLLLYIVSSDKDDLDKNNFLQHINTLNIPIIILINKIDLINQDSVKGLINEWKEKCLNAVIIPISALKKFNIEKLNNQILSILPESPAYFPKDTLTDRSERFVVSEIIREKILDRYKQEIPYSVEVVVTKFHVKDKLIVIDATIFVERESQKGIILGKKGVAINAVGTVARKSMQNFFNKKIYLGLFVKVSKDWRNKKLQLKRFGYINS